MATVEFTHKNSISSLPQLETDDNPIVAEIRRDTSVANEDSAVTVYSKNSRIEISSSYPEWVLEKVLDKVC